MKIMLGSKRHYYLARISIFLITVALIAGMSGCFTPFRMQYQLTISSIEGGKVTTPGEGIFTYWEGTTVNLVAEADEGYCFSNWTGNVSTIGNVTSATTNITMNCNYAITANFDYTPMVTAGGYHTVGLKFDGTVVALGGNTYGQCNVAGWGLN